MIRVRPLEAGDRTAWDPLWEGYLAFYEEELAPGVTELAWSRLLDPLFDLHGLLAFDGDGKAVGLCHYLFHPSTWARGPYCYLEDLFVAPQVRGTGAGRALIEAVYAAADERGAEEVYWMTHESNTTARRLYDRVGTLSPFVRYVR